MGINYRAFLAILYCMSLQAWFGILLRRDAIQRVSRNQDIPEMQYQKCLSRNFGNELPSYEETILDILINSCTLRKKFLGIAYGDLYIRDFQKMVHHATKIRSDLVRCFLGHLMVDTATHIALKKQKTDTGEEYLLLNYAEVYAAWNRVAYNDSDDALAIKVFLSKQIGNIRRSKKNRWS